MKALRPLILAAQAATPWRNPHDSLRLVQDSMERLQPRGPGPDPLAERYPVGRDVVAPLEVSGTPSAPDLRAKLLRQLRGQLRGEMP